MEELISVIIPVYKVEEYIDRCLDSVVSQTYHNLEIILIDDGSPDRCPEICDNWAKKDSRFKVIHQKNMGVAEARNTGLDSFTGKYLAFVDSDDCIEPDMIETLYRKLKVTEADIVICGIDKKNIDGTDWIEQYPICNEVLTSEGVFRRSIENGGWQYTVLWNKLYTREVIGDVRFISKKIHEDEMFCSILFTRCKKVVCMEKKLYHYLQRPNSIMTGSDAIEHLDGVEAMIRRYYIVKENGMKKFCTPLVDIIICVYVNLPKTLTKQETKEQKKRIQEIYKMIQVMYMDYNVFFHVIPPGNAVLFIHNIIYGIKQKLRIFKKKRN